MTGYWGATLLNPRVGLKEQVLRKEEGFAVAKETIRCCRASSCPLTSNQILFLNNPSMLLFSHVILETE